MMADDNASTARGTLRRLADITVFVMLVFVAIVFVLTLSDYLRLRAADPLNDPELVSLRDAYAADVASPELRASIREKDYAARQMYFRQLGSIRVGGYLGMAAGMVLMLALGVRRLCGQTLPRPPAVECQGLAYISMDRAGTWLLMFGILVVTVCLVVALATPSSSLPDETEMRAVD